VPAAADAASPLSSQVALVSGGSSGIGLEIARQLGEG
jgi:NAD(P)-dependent dehydrogenase (short-subunit alcohol dehydrogenase family)